MQVAGKIFMVTLMIGFIFLGSPIGMDTPLASQNPCSEDVTKFCPNIEPGPAGMIALMQCLEEHENELSNACREYEAGIGGPRMDRIEDARQKSEFRQNCMGDMARFCRGAGPMQRGMMKCLKEHENELSAACRKSMNALK